MDYDIIEDHFEFNQFNDSDFETQDLSIETLSESNPTHSDFDVFSDFSGSNGKKTDNFVLKYEDEVVSEGTKNSGGDSSTPSGSGGTGDVDVPIGPTFDVLDDPFSSGDKDVVGREGDPVSDSDEDEDEVVATGTIVRRNGTDYTLPSNFEIYPQGDGLDYFVWNPFTGEMRVSPWVDTDADIDWWGVFLDLGIIAVGAVGGSFGPAWLLPTGSGLGTGKVVNDLP